jgi:hypothetical protein
MSTGKRRHRRPFRWPSYGKPSNAMLLPVIPPFSAPPPPQKPVWSRRG